MDSIPVIDFSALSLDVIDDDIDEVAAQRTAEKLVHAFETIGFAYLSNTAFPTALVSSGKPR
jgi:isopenicillin N synthase-like dioxygenase